MTKRAALLSSNLSNLFWYYKSNVNEKISNYMYAALLCAHNRLLRLPGREAYHFVKMTAPGARIGNLFIFQIGYRAVTASKLARFDE